MRNAPAEECKYRVIYRYIFLNKQLFHADIIFFSYDTLINVMQCALDCYSQGSIHDSRCFASPRLSECSASGSSDARTLPEKNTFIISYYYFLYNSHTSVNEYVYKDENYVKDSLFYHFEHGLIFEYDTGLNVSSFVKYIDMLTKNVQDI